MTLRLFLIGASAAAALVINPVGSLDCLVNTAQAQPSETSLYESFKSTLEQTLGAPVHCLYENGYNHSTKKPGDFYAIVGSDQELLIKKVEAYQSYPGAPKILMDNSILSLSNNQNGTYTVTTGAYYSGGSLNLKSKGIANGGGGSCYASATGKKDSIPQMLNVVKAWQDTYDQIFKDSKAIFFAKDGLTKRKKLENILEIYRERFTWLADSSRWPGLNLSDEAKTVLRNSAATYNLEDVAMSLMGR